MEFHNIKDFNSATDKSDNEQERTNHTSTIVVMVRGGIGSTKTGPGIMRSGTVRSKREEEIPIVLLKERND